MSLISINFQIFFRMSRAAEAHFSPSQQGCLSCYHLLPYAQGRHRGLTASQGHGAKQHITVKVRTPPSHSAVRRDYRCKPQCLQEIGPCKPGTSEVTAPSAALASAHCCPSLPAASRCWHTQELNTFHFHIAKQGATDQAPVLLEGVPSCGTDTAARDRKGPASPAHCWAPRAVTARLAGCTE